MKPIFGGKNHPPVSCTVCNILVDKKNAFLDNTGMKLKGLCFSMLTAALCVPFFAQTVFDLTVQPFSETDFCADGIKIQPQVLETDKSIAKVRFIFDKPITVLEVKHEGFRPVNIKGNALLQKSGYAFLSPENSQYDVAAVFETGRKPKSLRFINEKLIAAALLDGDGADIINIETGTVTRIKPPDRYALRKGFVETLVPAAQNELWLSQMTSACIHVFNLADFDYKFSIQTSGAWSKVMAYNHANKQVYVSNWISKDISVINPLIYKEEMKIPVAAVPRGMAFSQDGLYMYCAQFEDGSGKSRCRLIKKNLTDFKTICEAGSAGAKRHIVTDYRTDRLYVSDMFNSCIEIYSLKDDSLIASVKVFNNPNTIALSPDGTRLYVSCRGPNHSEKGYEHKGKVTGRLDIIDTHRLTRIESIEAGNQPTGLDVSPDGTFIVLSDFLDDRVRLFRFRTPFFNLDIGDITPYTD